MVIARVRRFAWLLILVLVTGLASPMLASAATCDAPPAAMTHQHADGSVHSHHVKSRHDRVGATANRNAGGSQHCQGCLTEALCAWSCLDVAVLPASLIWSPVASAAAWPLASVHAPSGVAPLGDIEPPRPVLRS